MTSQPPVSALHFGRTNKLRPAADIALDIMTNLAITQMKQRQQAIIIDADEPVDMTLPFTEDLGENA